MKIIFYILLFLPYLAFAQRQKVDPISFGVVTLAEDRMPIDLNSFRIKSEGEFEINGKMIKDSLQWVRLDKSLLVPRALLEVSFKKDQLHRYSWEYARQKIIPLFDNNTGLYKAHIFVSLFESLPLELYEDNRIVSTVRILPQSSQRSNLIDYTCAPYFVEIEGIKNDYLSVGCKIQRTGKFGDEKPYLEVLLTSASYRLKDQSEPPYLIVFHETGESKISLVDYLGNEEVITIKAKLPKKLPRLRLAAGFGPYTLDNSEKFGNAKSEIAPTVMLYGNFSLNDSSSLRFFDSYSKNIATFHNWGAYFAWDLAEFCDQRCLLTSLIGAQGVDYQYNSNFKSTSEKIFPQGFEFVYKHPFGNLNYKFSYGMFASFSGLYDYQNIWVRYGKNYFWELNYIEWQRDKKQASMFGLSIGFPIASFF
jgi:hypothetical protein